MRMGDAAEKALILFPPVKSGRHFLDFHLKPPRSSSPLLPIPAHPRLLSGTPADLSVGEVYDLIRPWGALSVLRHSSSESDGSWEVGFWREFDAQAWEQEWDGGCLGERKVSVRSIRSPWSFRVSKLTLTNTNRSIGLLHSNHSITSLKAQLQVPLPDPIVSPARRRRASFQSIRGIIRHKMEANGSTKHERVVEYHGSTENFCGKSPTIMIGAETTSKVVHSLSMPSKEISGPPVQPSGMATLRCHNIPHSVDSMILFQRVNAVSFS